VLYPFDVRLHGIGGRAFSRQSLRLQLALRVDSFVPSVVYKVVYIAAAIQMLGELTRVFAATPPSYIGTTGRG